MKNLNLKTKETNSKGITLVALIITIIVLLILATVSINLVINNGILDKAKTAVDRYSDEEVGEQIKLAYLECQTQKIYISNLDEEEFMTNSLKQTFGNDNVRNVSVTNKKVVVEIKTKGDFVRYLYNAKTGIAKFVQDWKQESDGSYSNGSTRGVKVGDVVHYETELAKTENAVNSTKLTELRTDLATYSGTSSSTDNADIDRDSLTWKVLDIKDGKIRLISTVPTTKKIKLNSYNGYNNAVYLIDKACDTLYSIDREGKAQNLKIEDIESHLTYDYTQYKSTDITPNVKYNETNEYTSSLNYPNIYPSEIGCKAIATVDNTQNTLGLSEQTSPVTGRSTATNGLKTMQTSWYKSMVVRDFTDSNYYTLFMNNGSNLAYYWLSSRCVRCRSNHLYFEVRYVGSSKVEAYYIGNGYDLTLAYRPIITLESNVELNGNSTDGWKIN